MKVAITTILLMAVAAVNAIDVNHVVDQAELELRSELMDKVALGHTTSRVHRKKWTKESRIMSDRNAIMRRSFKLLVNAGVQEHEARVLVANAIRERQAGGQRNNVGKTGGMPTAPVVTIDDTCEGGTVPVCTASDKYRTIDGFCNNLDNPYWGAMSISMRRYADPVYQDGAAEPVGGLTSGTYIRKLTLNRRAGGNNNNNGKGGNNNNNGIHPRPTPTNNNCPSGSTFPNARDVSTTFHADADVESTIATHMLVQMGQFLDHDITLTPESEVEHCCDDSTQAECFVIPVSDTDSFYSQHNQTCLEFTRSTVFCETNGADVREQMNAITAYVDASNVYASDSVSNEALREGSGGLMAVTSTDAGKELLPKIDDVYTAGDVRALEMPGLASVHTLWLREHNRIARLLAANNAALSDDDLFEEARRIVVAEIQNVVYAEYLPVVLGKSTMGKEGLNISPNSKYDASADASIANSFATAAYRFGHSMIQGTINRVAYDGTTTSYDLHENYFNVENYEGDDGVAMEEVLNGLLTQAAQANDAAVTVETTNFLLPEEGHDFGSDLVARNLQRGRDHGLPGYNAFREFCGLSTHCSWSDRPNEINADNWATLQGLYEQPSDIDLFTAGLAEDQVRGGITGVTFNCIKARQFKALKDGDRFFFTHKDQPGSFTTKQQNSIRQRRFKDIICDNTDIPSIREAVFDINSPSSACSATSTLQIQNFF